MLRLLAACQEDGWAFVRSGQEVYLVRPPYARVDRTRVDESTPEKAVATFGFSAEDREFPDWQALIAHLHKAIAEWRRANDQEVFAASAGEAYLSVASEGDIRDFLDRVERELLPRWKFDEAERLLHGMLCVPEIRENRVLGKRASELTNRLPRLRREADAARRRLFVAEDSSQSVSPLADRAYGAEHLKRYCAVIADSRQVFALSP